MHAPVSVEGMARQDGTRLRGGNSTGNAAQPPGERRTLALGCAGIGVAMGGYVAVAVAMRGTVWELPLVMGYLVLIVIAAVWLGRATRIVAGRARQIAQGGFAGLLVLVSAAVFARSLIVPDPQTGPPWWLLLLLAFIVAAPMLIAGHLIEHSGRRGRSW